MDFTQLLQQIFGKQPTQVQVSGQVGEGVPGPSKAQQFGELLQSLGGAAAPTTPTPTPASAPGGGNANAMELLKSLFGQRHPVMRSTAPSWGTGGRADRSGGDGSGGMSGRGSLY